MSRNHTRVYSFAQDEYGWLTVLTVSGAHCRCRCRCGKEVDKLCREVIAGQVKSCGCRRAVMSRERAVKRNTTHGMSDSPTYRCWGSMIARCYIPSETSYYRYGAVGITVCDRWRNSFEAFLEDVGCRPSLNHSIDRYPNKAGNYEPGNCRWATRTQQCRNRQSNTLLTHDGKTLSIVEWSELTGLPQTTIQKRIGHGWPVARTLTQPKRRYRS